MRQFLETCQQAADTGAFSASDADAVAAAAAADPEGVDRSYELLRLGGGGGGQDGLGGGAADGALALEEAAAMLQATGGGVDVGGLEGLLGAGHMELECPGGNEGMQEQGLIPPAGGQAVGFGRGGVEHGQGASNDGRVPSQSMAGARAAPAPQPSEAFGSTRSGGGITEAVCEGAGSGGGAATGAVIGADGTVVVQSGRGGDDGADSGGWVDGQILEASPPSSR